MDASALGDRYLRHGARLRGMRRVARRSGSSFVFVGRRIRGAGKASTTTTTSRSRSPSGQPFPTMEVPWGYAYFLAAFYRVFGDRPWIPLIAQVAAQRARADPGVRGRADAGGSPATATLAAVLTGVLSFNTVYASTQSSDAVCTVHLHGGRRRLQRRAQRDDWRLVRARRRADRPRAAIPAEPDPDSAACSRRSPLFDGAHGDGWAQALILGLCRRRHADAVGRPQLPADGHDPADQRPRRRAALVRHAADGAISATAGPTTRDRSSNPRPSSTRASPACRSS